MSADLISILSDCEQGVWVIDLQGRTRFANESLARLLETTPDAMRGVEFTTFMPPEEVELANFYFGRRLTGNAEVHEFRFRTATGRDVWATVAGVKLSPARLAKGALFCAIVVESVEHTYSTDSADLLYQGLRRIISLLSDPVAFSAADGCIAVANDAFWRALRHPPATGEPLQDVFRHMDARVGETVTGTDSLGNRRMQLAVDSSGPESHALTVTSFALSPIARAPVGTLHLVHATDPESSSRTSVGAASDREEQAVIALQAAAMRATQEGMAILLGDTYLFVNPAHAAVYGW